MYTDFYNLFQKPFENTPNPDFLYLSKMHREVLASLIYGVKDGKGFVLVAGDVGTGKTTLIHALLQNLDQDYLIFHIINPRYTFNEILQHLAKKLLVSAEGRTSLELTENIRERLETLDGSGKRAVLIIDEAHHLSEESLEEIRLITNIETEKRKLIQIILVGQNEINRKIQRDSLRQLKQRIVLNRTLRPLDKNETMEYINHRLKIAGRKTPLFKANALSLIWKKSKGFPRVINQLCDNSLVIGFALNARVVGPKIIKEVAQDMASGMAQQDKNNFLSHINIGRHGITAAVVLLIALIAAYAINFYDHTISPSDNVIAQTLPSIENPELQPIINKSDDVKNSPGSSIQSEGSNILSDTQNSQLYAETAIEQPSSGNHKELQAKAIKSKSEFSGLNEFILSDDATIWPQRKTEILAVLGDGMFRSGQVIIDERMLDTIRDLVPHILTYPDSRIIIEGHTDSSPIKAFTKMRYRDNMELSFFRAKAIALELDKNGVPLDRISVVGYGDIHPVASNATEEGRIKNRRVAIKLVHGEKEAGANLKTWAHNF